ncbi:Serine/threonine-protein phosphatase 2A activator 2 [Elasticomyces elasticus]|nr:Serine/threonine-protein phosphatase 2A activator 2 [Elasticomyces elasticus]KAK5005283.1 hypothetical protein LTR28_007904 [Elasticomyces elasticus]
MPSRMPDAEPGVSLHSLDLSAKLPRLPPPRRRRLDPTSAPSNPPPETPALSAVPNRQHLNFSRPIRRILSKHDHDLFLASPTYTLLVAFIFALSDTVGGKPISQIQMLPRHPVVELLLDILDEAESVVAQCPPLDTGSRFGNPAFRTYLSTLEQQLDKWHTRLGIENSAAIEETSTYLSNSFGSSDRIDYGSGHELNFFLWLLCLRQLSILPDSTFPTLTLVVFPRYLALMRKLQTTYYLEPAGSHGVWGLDDYQFLPFLFGASQLVGHPYITPLSIHNSLIIEECSKDYLYLNQVEWVKSQIKVVNEPATSASVPGSTKESVSTGSKDGNLGLRWHSPMLDDISAAKSWAKIEGGLRKMFLAEVLRKLPVMQHFLFGSILPAAEGMSPPDAVESESVTRDEGHEGHEHKETGWGDCCGIQVPSSVGAMQEMRKRMGGEGSLRRVPFD